jgi:3-methyladenine DNA glycosylase Mpg
MKVVDVVGQSVGITNEEDKLLRYIIAHDAPNISKLNERYQKVADDLIRKNVLLISNKGTLKVNFPRDVDKWL